MQNSVFMSCPKIENLLHGIPPKLHDRDKMHYDAHLRLISAGLILSLLLLQSVLAEQLKETKRVLVLHSEDKANPAHELTDVGINSAFRSNTLFDVQLYIEYLDGSRFSGPAHDQCDGGLSIIASTPTQR